MPEKKQVIYNIDKQYLAQRLVEELKLESEDEGLNLQFAALRDIVKETSKLVEVTFYPNMAYYIGVEQIGKPHGVIWAPNPGNADWFKRLRNEGYDGKRILVAGSSCREYFDELAKNATATITMPTNNIVDKILKVLK